MKEKWVEKELWEKEKDLLMNNVIKIIKWLEDLCVLIHGVTGTVIDEIKK